MFDEIAIRSRGVAGSTPPIDLGILVESMIFYRRVDLILDRGTLPDTVARLGADLFTRLVETEQLAVRYCPSITGVRSENGDLVSSMDAEFIVAELEGDVAESAIERSLTRIGLSDGRARRLARRLECSVDTVRFDEALVEATEEDASDPNFVNDAIRLILAEMAPDLTVPGDLRFEIDVRGDGRVGVSTNLDLEAATKACRRIHPTDVAVNIPLLLGNLMAVHEDLHFSAMFGSELGLPRFQSDLIRLKFASVFEERDRADGQLGQFQEVIFEGSKAIAEAIRSEQVSLEQGLDLADGSRRFNEWIAGREPDSQLLSEYVRASTRRTWADRLPAKASRWAVVTAAETGIGLAVGGTVGLVAGLVVGTGDFIEASLREGWRPSHFIEGPVRRALNT